MHRMRLIIPTHYTQRTSIFPGSAALGTEGPFENFPFDANPTYYEEATDIPQFYHPLWPTYLRPPALMDSPFASPSLTAITQGVSTSQSSSSQDPYWSDHSSWDWGVPYGVPNVPPKRRRWERPALHALGQGGSDRGFTCPFENCGRTFSGEWEKARHVKSVHYPPTIGCRECTYRQSRKDLFWEHCKKRHPGRSIEDLMVQLVMPS